MPIGNSSSQSQYPDEAGEPESYVRKEKRGEKNMSEEIVEKSTTEPDPEGDIAVTKSANSDLARSDIEKAIEALTSIMKSLPDVSRAADVTVDNETLSKSEGLPDTERAGDVSVSNETAPVKKDVGNPDDVAGQGENSEPANTTVEREAGVITKSCGPDCAGDTCEKCMGKDITSAEVVEKAADGDDAEPDTDEDDKEVYKSAKDLINDAKMTKSVWGGAFGAPSIPRIK